MLLFESKEEEDEFEATDEEDVGRPEVTFESKEEDDVLRLILLEGRGKFTVLLFRDKEGAERLVPLREGKLVFL